MPNASVQQCVNKARALMNEPNSSGRFSDTALISFCEDASKFINRDIYFPDAKYVFPTTANVQIYKVDPLPLLIYSVYINGQLIIPVDGSVMTLNGQQQGWYDQSFNGAPATVSGTSTSAILGSISGSASGSLPSSAAIGASSQDAPTGSQGVYSPQWIAATPATYPLANQSGGTAPTGLPYRPGDRGRYYWRGGEIGFVPAPASSGEIVEIDCCIAVPALTAIAQTTMFPDTMILAIAWKMVELAKFSEDGPNSAEGRNYAATQYEMLVRDFRTWNRRRTGDAPRTLQVRTRRSAYITASNRGGVNNPGGY